jgi:hypothetical protein
MVALFCMFAPVPYFITSSLPLPGTGLVGEKIPYTQDPANGEGKAHTCEIGAVEKLFPSKFAERKSRDACLLPATLASRNFADFRAG